MAPRTNYITPLTDEEKEIQNNGYYNWGTRVGLQNVNDYQFETTSGISDSDKAAIRNTQRRFTSPAPTITPLELKEVNLLVASRYGAKLQALKDLGFYNMKVDNKWGNGSRAAEKAALDAGYTWNGTTYVKGTLSTADRNANNLKLDALKLFGYEGELNGVLGPSANAALLNASKLGYIWSPENNKFINPNNFDSEFANYMYDKGTSASRAAGNILTTFAPFAKALFRNESSADYHSKGTDELIIAAMYGTGSRPKDADLRIANGETITYSIGKNSDGGYAWRNINGNKDVSEGGLLRNGIESGSHTLGQFTIEESPNGIRILDNYDFNNRGESGTRIDNGTAGLYDHIRAAMPNKVDNPEYNGLSIDWSIDRDTINNYLNEFRKLYPQFGRKGFKLLYQ